MKKIHFWYHIQKCIRVSFVSLYGLIVPEQFDFLNEQTVPEYALSNFISTNSMKNIRPFQTKTSPRRLWDTKPKQRQGLYNIWEIDTTF